MEIAIFNEITTERALLELEENGKKYKGLFVDMSDAPQRKFVKESASFINGLLKTLDRARIDKSRDYKTAVEKEAEAIRLRLEAANEPYTLLIDQYSKERAEILAAKKAREEAAELLIKIAEDHDSAIMEDKVRTFEAAEKVRAQQEHEAQIAQQAKEQAEAAAKEAIEQAKRDAVAAEERRIAYEAQVKQDAIAAEARAKQAALDAAAKAERDIAQAKEDAEAKAEQAAAAQRKRIEDEAHALAEAKRQREANIEHKGNINRRALVDLMHFAGIEENDAKAVIKSIAKGQINAVTINY